MRIARYGISLGVAALVLWLASRATTDCAVSPYLAENCLTLWVGRKLGVPFTPAFRAIVLGIAGLGLLAGGYIVLRWVLRRPRADEPDPRGPLEAPRR